MDYSTLAQPWQQKAEQGVRLPTLKNYKFFYKHHPKNWELNYFYKDEEEVSGTGKNKTVEIVRKEYPVMLPSLSTQKEIAGVNGIEHAGRGQANSTIWKAKLFEQGWTIIEPSKVDYLRVYPCRNGNYHATKFDKLENLGGMLVNTFDHEAYKLFRLELVSSGIIRPIHPHIIKQRIIEIQRLCERKYQSQHIPQIAEQLNNLEKAKKDIGIFLERLERLGVDVYNLQK